MPTINLLIKYLKQFSLLGLVLFSLAPCLLKMNTAKKLAIPFEKTSNSSKSTHTTSCSYYSFVQSSSTKLNEDKQICYFQIPIDRVQVIHNILQLKYSDYTYASNSPPKYILYKRMKMGIV